jgi:hypothetical protein
MKMLHVSPICSIWEEKGMKVEGGLL